MSSNQSNSSSPHRIHGRITTPNGRPAAGVLVRAFDRGLRSEELLGEAKTDKNGDYEIRYAPEQLKRAEKGAADLVVRALSDGTPPAGSPIHFKAQPDETIDLVVAVEAPSEYESLMEEVTPLLDKVPIAELREDDEHRDVSFLAGETGRSEMYLVYLVLAHRYAQHTKLPAEAFYGLFRDGMPTELAALQGQSALHLEAALRAAAKSGFVSAKLVEEAPKLAERLVASGIADSLRGNDGNQPSPLGAVLSLALPEPEQQERFLKAFLAHEGPSEHFWNRASEDRGFAEGRGLEKLKLTVEIGALTQNHAPLVKHVLDLRESGKLGEVRDLAGFSAADWERLVREAGGPPADVPGKNEREKTRLYAQALERTLEDTFPTAAVAARFQADLQLGKSAAAKFFAANPDFDLRTANLEALLGEDQKEVKSELQGVQRLFKLAPRFRQMKALMDTGADSAHAVACQSRNSFVEQHAASMGAVEAGKVHDKAAQIAATALNLVAEYAPAFRGVTPAVLDGEAPAEAALAGVPNWEALFGSGDYCECEHCRSVYGPAAYLVDVLDFLAARQANPPATTTAKEILFRRRADLGEIELTCENTNTPVPYVDLVNELLENAVSATAIPARQRQTTGTAAELAANPQHVNAGAYAKLKDAVFPWDLPFDLWLEECRTYLGHLGLPRQQLMETLRKASLSDVDLAGERLGFSVAERKIVAPDAPPTKPWEFYGFDSETDWIKDISIVRTFLDRTGLLYEDLDGLLALRFVNPGQNIVIGPKDSTKPACDTTNLELRNLDAAALDRIHRFVRLQRRLGWPMRDLDRAIFALRAGAIDKELLIELADLQRLAAELDLPIARLLAFYAPLDTFLYAGEANDPPLYDQLFLNPTIIKPVPVEFALKATRDELATIGDLGNKKVATALLAALGLTGDDLAALIDAVPLDSVTNKKLLNRANLTRIARSIFLARALGLRIADCLRLLKRAGSDLDPFFLTDSANPKVAPGVPARTLAFTAVAGKLAESGFTLAEVELLLSGGTDSASPATPPDDALARVLEDIRAGHQEIVKATSEVTDSTGDHTRRQLTLLGWDADLLEEALGTLLGKLTYTASLAVLPDKLVFPEPVRDKISYDTVAKVLRYAAPMTLAEKTALLALSTDSAYKNAVEALFKAPRDLIAARMNAFLTEEDASEIFDDSVSGEVRLGKVLEKLMPYLRRTRSEALVLQKAVTALGLDRATGEALFTTRLHSRATPTDPLLRDLLATSFLGSDPQVKVTRAAFPVPMDALSLAYRVAFVIARLGINARQLPWVIGRAATAGWLNLDALPLKPADPAATFTAWLRLLDLVRLRDGMPKGEAALTRVFDLADRTGTTVDTLLQALAEETGWSLTDVKDLAGNSCFNLQLDDFKNEKALKALLRLQAAFALLGRLGVGAERALAWARQEPTQADALDARQAAKARFTDQDWLAAAGSLRNGLRERQRASLVSYLVQRPGTGQSWNDANSLFQHFLIDVEMSPCQLTSRVKQATSSAQLFVQRCLMNLEKDVKADAAKDTGWRDWKWMKSYQVWAAARQVFLYPENFVEPGLRDDKSPFCIELENELIQRELTDESAEEAYLHYLEKLDTVARLDVQGVYHQVEPGVDVLHVFARTRNTPHIYYYRRRVNGFRWTAWERMDLDIEGDHLIPFVWARRLHLFWAVFTLESDPQTLNIELGEDVAAAKRYWRIQLAWTQLKNGKWEPKKLTRESLQSDGDQPPQLSAFRFWAGVHESQGDLHVFAVQIVPGDAKPFHVLGEFIFTGCHGTVVPNPEKQSSNPVLPKRTQVWGMELVEATLNEEPLYLGQDAAFQSLDKTPSDFNSPFRLLVHPKVDMETNPSLFTTIFQEPFFFTDEQRTLFVEPKSGVAPVAALRAGESSPPPAEELSLRSIPPPAGPVKTQGLEPLLQPPAWSGQALARRSAVRALTASSQASRLLAGSSERLGGSFELAATRPAFRFHTFYHPYVCLFIRELNRFGVDGILNRKIQVEPWNVAGQRPFDFARTYSPTRPPVTNPPTPPLVAEPYPVEDVDFSPRGSYALYNWELFFFIPLTIAVRLSQNQRFEEAERWFNSIFDPKDTSGTNTRQRFWRTRPFFDTADATYRNQQIEELLRKLASGDTDLEKAVQEWRLNPLNAHAVARLRTTAYQKAVVMEYLNHLLRWGDQLFRRDTLESLNEATQLYVLAAEILGRRPERVKSRSAASPKTHNELGSQRFADLSRPLAAAELLVPETSGDLALTDAAPPPRFLLSTFCVPNNEKLLGYWDLVADRLFKLRHCMNIEGVERQLALFEPLIDPALLVRAAAAGVDLGSVLADVNAVLPPYRFPTMAAKAAELCAEVKSLGAALLSALEKRDAEALSLLRSSHEIGVLTAAREVRRKQIDEARETLAGLERSLELAAVKKRYYSSRQFINRGEAVHLALSQGAIVVQSAAAAVDLTGSILALIPDVKLGCPTTIGFTYGGNNLASGLKGLAGSLGLVAGILSSTGSLAATLGGYERRRDDWNFQAELAQQEITQIKRQIAAAQVRLAIAEKELDNHDLQVENAREVEAFLRDKFTNRELYDWMVSQISGVYFQAYQLAYDVAKRAERAYRFELAIGDSSFIRFGYWDSLKKGLLAGEKLHQDLKRMEVSYLDENRREYEITQRFSLALHDPAALLKLKTTGECFFSVPEAFFDLANPGHYQRRLKRVGLTVACVTGPYTGVHCTLTLLNSSVRRESRLSAGKYARQENDRRFTDASGSIQSIVTSGGSEDAGLFETSLQEDRYVPFERAGAISAWHLRLPAAFPAFDYDTISDVVLHLRYTAREGGGALRDKAVDELRQALNTVLLGDGRKGLYLRVSARHDFPDAWARFMNPDADKAQTLSLDLPKDRFPFFLQERKLKVDSVQVLLQLAEGKNPAGTGTDTWIDTYAKGDKLNVTLAPPAGTEQNGDLASSPHLFKGQPSLTLPSAHVVGASSGWTLTATRTAIEKIALGIRTVDKRLAPGVVEDLQLVFHYTIEA